MWCYWGMLNVEYMVVRILVRKISAKLEEIKLSGVVMKLDWETGEV